MEDQIEIKTQEEAPTPLRRGRKPRSTTEIEVVISLTMPREDELKFRQLYETELKGWLEEYSKQVTCKMTIPPQLEARVVEL